MKRSMFFYLTTFMFLSFLAMECSRGNVHQEVQRETQQADSMKAQCINRMNDFLKWYVPFSMADDSERHVLKFVRMRGKKVYRIDTLGTKEDIEKYYGSGFFTKSWKDHTMKNLLAADTELVKLRTDDELVLADNVDISGVMGDLVLSLAGHSNWFMYGYKWEVKGYKTLRADESSIDLFYMRSPTLVNKWTFHLVLEHGQIKIDHVSGLIPVQ